MATYYVKTAAQGGSNAANGLSASTAWATVAYALSSSSGFASGDTLYVAPGIYTNAITVTIANPTVETNIIGDVTAAQFTGINPGVVVLTNFNSTLTGTGVSANVISATTKDYLHFQNIQFKLWNYQMVFTTCSNLKFTKCTVFMKDYYPSTLVLTSAVGQAVNATFTKCVFMGGFNTVTITGQNVADTTSFTDCIFMGADQIGLYLISVQASIYNCTFLRNGQSAIRADSGSLTYLTTVRNCLAWGHANDLVCVSPSFTIIENYNRLISYSPRSNVANNLTSSNAGDLGVDTFESILYGLPNVQPFSSYLTSPNASFGNATGAPSVDIYGNTWSGSSPDTGAATYKVVTGAYTPTERNAGVITIAPGSTSQSIELYLGATGLAFNTSGLAAYYVRNRTAPTPITLVTQTATGTWASGGFAEISSTFTPGLYRLDVPNDAFAAGFSDVTIVVRGASGTNGAVLTVTLSSGGLTAAQTANAVWDEPYTSHTTANTFGARTLKTTVDNRPAVVGASQHIHANVHAIVDSTVAADELKGALLHDSTGYVDTDVAQISSSTSNAVLDAAASSHNSAGSIGALIQDKTGYSLSTPQSFSTTGSVGGVIGNVTGSVATVANPDNIIDGVWDEQRVGHTASGSFGEKLQTNVLADEMLARDLGSGFNAGNPEERTVRSALRAIRNKVNVGSSQMVVKKEDDTTDAWTASVTTTAVSSNVSGIDPN